MSTVEMSNELSGLPELARRINEEHAACLAASRDAIGRAIEVGRLLTEARSQLPHGEWGRWVDENCRFGARQAQKYTRVYLNREAIEDQMRTGSALLTSLNAAVNVLAEPRPEDKEGLRAKITEALRVATDVYSLPFGEWQLLPPDALEAARVLLEKAVDWQGRYIDLTTAPHIPALAEDVAVVGRLISQATAHKIHCEYEFGKILREMGGIEALDAVLQGAAKAN